MTYHQQLKHPLWQKKRLEVLEDRGFECESCGEKEKQLHVHHSYYRRGAMIWEYEKEELRVFCDRCHKDEHAIDEKIRSVLADPNMDKRFALGLLDAQIHPNAFCYQADTEEQANGYLAGNGIDRTFFHLFVHALDSGKFYVPALWRYEPKSDGTLEGK